MRIWHLNVGNHAGRVDGVAMMSLRLANAQASAGHDVWLWVATAPEFQPAVQEGAHLSLGLGIHDTPWASARAMLAALDDPRLRPDVMHVHSVFRPVHALLAKAADRRGIPVVQTPHAGLDPILLRRDALRKSVYRWLIERGALSRADAVVALQAVEADDVVRFSGRRGPVDVVPNAVDSAALTRPGWQLPPEGTRPTVLMLSRYDVLQKGLDRMVAIAHLLPDVDFRIHGSQDKNEPGRTSRVMASAPPNVQFLPPVYDDEKYEALEAATLFLLPSRAEGLSLALTEAMAVGMPCAVSGFVDRSLGLKEQDAALVLDDEPVPAAAALRELLGDRERLEHLGSNAAAFAARHFDPERVVDAYLTIYERVRAARAVQQVPPPTEPTLESQPPSTQR